MKRAAQVSLSQVLAARMVVVALSVCLLLTIGFLIQYVSDTPWLREETLNANALAVVHALEKGQDPAALPLYRDYPQAYGFRVFRHRALTTRRVLASANTRWLPAIQHPASTPHHPNGDPDLIAIGTDLTQGFSMYQPPELRRQENNTIALLIQRISVRNRHYWVQIYMVGDPALAGATVVIGNLISHVFEPALIFIPILTIAMFLTTRSALHPLRQLSDSAQIVGAAVASGQTLNPVPEHGMAREFIDVAATINTILAKLNHSLQLQKQFTSDVAHELRTPLAVLLLETSRLPRSPEHERIKADLKELSQLVNELLRFAQAEDVMAVETNLVDIADVARKVTEESVGEALAKRQLIEFQCSHEAMTTRGNAALIEIAIRNLVYNALKYSPTGTTVTVRLEPGPVVIVEDRGPGIPPEQRDHVFERFRRVDSQSGNGAGVGLALVRRIAQLHDGNVRMEDRPGGGARLVLSFSSPVSEPPQSRRPGWLPLAAQIATWHQAWSKRPRQPRP